MHKEIASVTKIGYIGKLKLNKSLKTKIIALIAIYLVQRVRQKTGVIEMSSVHKCV